MPNVESAKTVTLMRRDGSTEPSISPMDLRVMGRNGEVHPLDQVVSDRTGQRTAAWKIKGLFPKSMSDALEEVYSKGLDPTEIIAQWEAAHVQKNGHVRANSEPPELIPLAVDYGNHAGWFVLDEGVVQGPYGSDVLASLARQGRLTSNSNVSRTPNGPWMIAGQCVPLAGLFQSERPADRILPRRSRRRRCSA